MSAQKLIITPISRKLKSSPPCSKSDYTEQEEREQNNLEVMWDDSRFNTAEAGDYFGFVFNFQYVLIRKVSQTMYPSERLESWADNVGQTDRQVLYLSKEILRINWDTWIELNGHRMVRGTTPVSSKNTMLFNYIRYYDNDKYNY